MRAVQIGYAYDPGLHTPEELLSRYYVLTTWCGLLASAGVRVVVFQRFHQNAVLNDNGVEYRFVRDQLHPSLRKWEIPLRLHSAVCEHSLLNNADLVHVNGLVFPLQVRHLRHKLPSQTAIVVQDHANPPWPAPLARLQKWGLCASDGFLFTTKAQTDAWTSRDVIPRDRIVEVSGAWTSFAPSERTAARARTGMKGFPVVLWAGNLTPNKDPLTVLAGFARVRAAVPSAHLYMAYVGTDLLPEVRTAVDIDSRLKQSVTLLGPVDHEQMVHYFNSADYFVLGSHHEGSGFALVEAMACGCVPIVTNIPSFSRLMGNGGAGRSWQAGSAEDFAHAFLQAMQEPVESARKNVLRHYVDHLSPVAIARQAAQAYDGALRSRQGRRN